jgi:hypothetical protein
MRLISSKKSGVTGLGANASKRHAKAGLGFSQIVDL